MSFHCYDNVIEPCKNKTVEECHIEQPTNALDWSLVHEFEMPEVYINQLGMKLHNILASHRDQLTVS